MSRISPTPAPPATTRLPEHIPVLADDGWRLSMRLHRASPEAPGGRRGSVLALHAMMVDGRTFEPSRSRPTAFVDVMSARGWDVYVGEFRGRAGSGPTPQEGADWSYDDLVRRDVPAFVRTVRERSGGGPLVAVGHSLGSHTMAASVGTGACATPPDGYVIMSGAIWLPRLATNGSQRMLRRLTWRTMWAAGKRDGYLPARRLGIGSADESMGYLEDLRRTWDEDAWTARDGEDYLAALPRIRGPILAVYGAGDAWLTRGGGTWNFIERYGPGRVERWLVGRSSGHGLDYDPNHMALLTDARSRPVWERIGAWMESL